MILDPSGAPFQMPPELARHAREVVIREDGLPTLPDGTEIVARRYPSAERLDAFLAGLGPGGYGNLGYRAATFQNSATGIGTSRDKTTWGNYWSPWRIPDPELLAMYNGSDLAAKIVETEAEEMFRAGWEVRSRDVQKEALKDLDKKAAEIRLNELFLEGCVWGRVFGGALNLIGAEDGRNPDEELNEAAIRTFHYLNVVDRRFIWVQRYYSDMLSPKFGLPEIYLITNAVAHGGMYGTTNPPPGTRLAAVSIHESRTIRWDGAKTDVLTRQQLAGWTFSVLQRVYDPLRRFDGSFDSVDNLLADASQGVFKIKNLMEMIANNQKEALLSRMQLVDFARSVARAIMVDADAEDFERKTTTFAGVPELLDRKMMRLAAAARMPVTRLFGRAAAGLNATGESDERMWLSTVRTKQTNELGPKIKRAYQLMAAAKDQHVAAKQPDFQIEFAQLWEPTDMEQSDRELKVAQRDQIYLQEGVLTPEEVKLGRFGSGKFSSWVEVDADELQKTIDGQVKMDPYANEPVPEGSLVNAAQQGEMQSPVVPLPLPGAPDLAGSERQKAAESPQRSKIPPPGAKPRSDSASIATAVHHQLQGDYPDQAIAWVLSADWKGPVRVPVDKIDWANAETWQASHDPVHVGVMRDRIESGIEKPVILVRVPHSKLLRVIDGHHRVTAYKALDKNIKAYVAKVNATQGPWDEMHSMQKEGLLGSNQTQGA